MTNQHIFMIVVEGQEEDVVRQIRTNLNMIDNASSIGYTLMPSALSENSHNASIKLAKLPKLTSRQQQILPLMLDGLSNKRIARVLGLSHFTVRNHITCIYHVFKVCSRRELSVALALGMQDYLMAAA